MKSIKQIIFFISIQIAVNTVAFAEPGFVNLPPSTNESAYITCNNSGDYGRAAAFIPTNTEYNRCALISDELNKSPLNTPLNGFKLVGVQVSDVEMIEEKAGVDTAVARLSEAIWRNQEKTECILATQLEMLDAPLANGKYFEINDVAHAGFANRTLAIAYFYKPHSKESGGNTEVLFRAGRTFTSVPTKPGQTDLPKLRDAHVASFDKTASSNENWVDFTTDVSFRDLDGVTRAHSSIFYMKYQCDGRDPVSVPNAIRLRSTGLTNQDQFELAVPGLIPADGNVDF